MEAAQTKMNLFDLSCQDFSDNEKQVVLLESERLANRSIHLHEKLFPTKTVCPKRPKKRVKVSTPLVLLPECAVCKNNSRDLIAEPLQDQRLELLLQKGIISLRAFQFLSERHVPNANVCSVDCLNRLRDLVAAWYRNPVFSLASSTNVNLRLDSKSNALSSTVVEEKARLYLVLPNKTRVEIYTAHNPNGPVSVVDWIPSKPATPENSVL